MPKRNLLDDKDRKIIKILREDCLTPFVKIADMLGVNEGTVRHRIKRLLNKGIIKRFTISTDPEMLGLHSLAFILVNVKHDKLEYAAKQLSRMQEVLEVHEIHTYGDLLLKVRARDNKDMAEIMNSIKGIDGIKDTQVVYVLNIWKEEAY